MINPQFTKTRHIQVSVDTSGYCQARCELCIWPELKSLKRVMTDEEFEVCFERLSGFTFEEFALNSINEPFVDRRILNKFERLIRSGAKIRNLFFSSNWLLPDISEIQRFVELSGECAQQASIDWLSVNATVSGIDEQSYDILQAGSRLENVNMPYRKLSFEQARANIILLARGLSTVVPAKSKIRLNIKAYGDVFTAEEFSDYWLQTLSAEGINPDFLRFNSKITLNHSFQTFGRSDQTDQPQLARKCSSGWLDRQIVVGPDGRVGLCCVEGAHKVVVGNIYTQTLDEMIASSPYQRWLRIALGLVPEDVPAPCRNCEFFV